MNQIITPLGNVALPLDVSIDISKNNPMYTSAEQFSINLTVPRGPNEHIFGYRNRLASAGTGLTIEAQFLFFGLEKIRGAIELISASDKGFDILIKGSRNSFFFENGATNIHDIAFGDENFVPDIPFPTDEEMLIEMKNTTTLERDWICFPCNIVDNYEQATNPWDFVNSKFIKGTGLCFAPYMRLHRALSRLFEFYGFSIADNWFTENQERKNIVIYRKEESFYSFLTIYKFFPKWTVLEFISEIENFFPVTICIDIALKEVRIIGDDSTLSDAPVGSLDQYIIGELKITFNDTKNGYELKYNYPSDDSVKQEVNYADEVVVTDHPSIFDFPTATKNAIMLHSIADGGFYKSVADGDAWKWEKAGNVAIDVRKGKKEITRETKIYPCMNDISSVTQDMTLLNPEGGTEVHPVTVKFQSPVCKGDGLYDTGYYWTNNFRLMVYRGMDTPVRILPTWDIDHALTYPMANFVNHKMNGDQWSGDNLELRWDTSEGLRGAETIAFLEGARKVNVTMVIHHFDLMKIDFTKVYLLKGQKVLISELVIHFARSEKVNIDATLLMQ